MNIFNNGEHLTLGPDTGLGAGVGKTLATIGRTPVFSGEQLIAPDYSDTKTEATVQGVNA